MREVTLQELLASRDRRAARQQELIRGFEAPVISLTVNYPGPVKLNAQTRFLFWEGVAAVDRAVPSGAVLLFERRELPTGPEGLWAVRMEPVELKRLTCALEETHPLGRLLDIDVVRAGGPLGRELAGAPTRTCLLCGGNPTVCRRSGLHAPEELAGRIDGMIRAFQQEGTNGPIRDH